MVGLYAGRTVVPKCQLVQKIQRFCRRTKLSCDHSWWWIVMGILEAGMSWNKDFSAGNECFALQKCPSSHWHTRCGTVPWRKTCLDNKALCFLLSFCWGDCFPTSSGANMISVGADTWLMCIIMQGSTCHLQWKQTSREFLSPWQRSESLSFSLTQPSKKIGRRKNPQVSIVLAKYKIRKKKRKLQKIISFFHHNCNLFYKITCNMPRSSNYR